MDEASVVATQGSTPEKPLAFVTTRMLADAGERSRPANAAESDTADVRYVYYMLYSDGVPKKSRVAINPEEPSLGRIRADYITPPHTLASFKLCLSRVEKNIKLVYYSKIFENSCDTQLKEGHISLRADGPGLSSDEPMTIIITSIPEPPVQVGRYLIKNRAADIYWEADRNPLNTVRFKPCTKESAKDRDDMKWDIKREIDGDISMTSPYAPSSWVGANLAGSTMPVLWRLFPADGGCWYLATGLNFDSQYRVPAAQLITSITPGTMATLKEGDQWQMWEFIPV